MKSYIRLTEPMVREGGKLRKASWDEALEPGG